MERFISILLVASTAARKLVVLDDNEWDSIVVTTSPVKITNSRFSPKNSTRPNARMLNECEEGDIKCMYDTQLSENVPEKSPPDTVQKFLEKFSTLTNVKINQDLRNASSKSYWNQIESEKHNHPFDDSRGWITLDPVPWSSSKVSKWKPNNVGDRPWMYGPPQQATSSPLWVTNGITKRPSAQYGLASNDIITDNRPSGFPLDSAPQNSYNRPQGPTILNTYRPVQNQQYTPQTNYQPIPQPGQYHYEHTTKHTPYQWQNTNNFPSPSSMPHPGNFQNNYQNPVSHPSSHPDSGNGEWVLLSTTKGYSVPQRFYDRKFEVMNENEPERSQIVSRSFKSKYLENDIESADRKADHGFGETVWNVDGINIIRTGKSYQKAEPKENNIESTNQPNEMTYKRTVRLTVLPALNNTSTFSHDGMLEVDANPQTVEEAQQEEERMKKLQHIAVVNKGPRRPIQYIPVRARGINTNQSSKKAAVLAAVGAGMIPATMAVLIPAALGRRRREIKSPQIPYQFIR